MDRTSQATSRTRNKAMRATVSLITYTVVLILLAQLASAATKKRAPINLDALCSDADIAIPVHGLDLLLEEFDETEHKCPAHVRAVMLELRTLVGDERACSMEKAEAIIEFANKYLRKSVDRSDEINHAASTKIPKALARFAISYGMQFNHVCKFEVMHTFLPFTSTVLQKALGQQRWELMRNFLDTSPLSSVLRPIAKRDEVVLPEDLFAVLPGLETEVEGFLTSSKEVDQIKAICASHFEPLYGPILLPIAHLQRAGFDGGAVRCPSDQKRQALFWVVTTFLCETVKRHTGDTVNAEKAHLIEELGAELETEVRDEIQGTVSEISEPAPIEPIERYEPRDKLKREDVIQTSRMGPHVLAFDANKDEAERLRDKMAARSFEVFKMMSRKGAHKSFVKKFFRLLAFKKDSEQNLDEARNGLVKLMHAKEEDSTPFKIAKLLKKIGVGILRLIGNILCAILKFICYLVIACLTGGGGGGGNSLGPRGAVVVANLP